MGETVIENCQPLKRTSVRFLNPYDSSVYPWVRNWHGYMACSSVYCQNNDLMNYDHWRLVEISAGRAMLIPFMTHSLREQFLYTKHWFEYKNRFHLWRSYSAWPSDHSDLCFSFTKYHHFRITIKDFVNILLSYNSMKNAWETVYYASKTKK